MPGTLERMSTPGGSSNPYAQPPHLPRPAAGNPYAAPPQPLPGAGGYGGGFGPPAPAPPGPPASGEGGKPRRKPGWLWALGGAVAASAVWGGTLAATGRLWPESPDLAGYAYPDDMCEAADTGAFQADLEPAEVSDWPQELGYQDEALDFGSCTVWLRPIGGRDANYVYLTYEATWHKSSDTADEFGPSLVGMEQYGEDDEDNEYASEKLTGLGDESYLVYRTDASTGALNQATLGVREGWFEFSLTWSSYLDSADYASLTDQEHVAELLREAAAATLANLRDGGTGDADTGEDGENRQDGEDGPEGADSPPYDGTRA